MRIVNAESSQVGALNRHIGEVATVIANTSDNGYDYALEFDEDDYDFHSAGRRGRNWHCYWVYAKNIELEENEGGAEICA